MIILNKVDLLPHAEANLATLRGLIAKLNPDARIIATSFAEVDVEEVCNTSLFSFEKAQQAPGWLRELRGEHVPETLEYGVSSFVYRRTRSVGCV